MTSDSTSTKRPLPPTNLEILSTASLETHQAHLLPPLTALINLCYSVGHTNGPHGILLPYSHQRLSTPNSLLEEVGNDGFILVLSIQASGEGKPKPIASASAKPFKELEHHELAQRSELLRDFKREAAALRTTPLPSESAQANHPSSEHGSTTFPYDATGLPKWEIVCNVVHPDHQKRGLAGLLYDKLIQEIRRRESNAEEKDVHLIIITMKELNEAYYQKRGFATTFEKRFEKGVGGSEVGFSFIEMERIV